MSADLRVYDQVADRLFDFALGVTRDRVTAAEIVGDVIVQAAGQGVIVDPFDPRYRLWLYVRTRVAVFERLASRGRGASADRVIDLPAMPADAVAGDRAAVVWAAIEAFSEHDQALLLLHLRHGLVEDRLATAMGVSTRAVAPLLRRALDRTRQEVGALLALVNPGALPELDGLQAGWDGTFSPYVRQQVVAAVEAEGLVVPDPVPLLCAVPLIPAPLSLRAAVADRIADIAPPTRALPADGWDIGNDDTIPPWAPGDTERLEVIIPVIDRLVLGSAPAEAATRQLPRIPPVPPPPGPMPVPEVLPSQKVVSSGPSSPSRTSRGRGRRGTAVPLLMGSVAALLVAGVIGAVVITTTQDAASPADDGATPAAGLSVDDGSTDDLAVTPGPPGPGGEAGGSPGRLTAPTTSTALDGEPVIVQLGNSGGSPITWRVKASPAWLTVRPSTGTIAAGSSTTITLSPLAGLEEGDYRGAVELAAGPVPATAESADPTAVTVVQVETVAEKPPSLGEVVFGSRVLAMQGCGQSSTEVAVIAEDSSGIDTVVGTVASPDSAEQTQVTLGPDPTTPRRFVGVVGPFTRAGTLTVTVDATDMRGNTTAIDAGTVTVDPCDSAS